jgi:hypothetical protein
MMASHIPFVNTAPDCDRLNKAYSDSEIVRVSLESIEGIKTRVPKRISLWVDPAIDGYNHLLDNSRVIQKWLDLKERFEENDVLSDSGSIEKPDSGRVQTFVSSVLDKCLEFRPRWITVPQLPLVNDSSRNKINKELAKATAQWKLSRGYNDNLILPLVFTHENQLKGKARWKPKLNTAKTCYDNSGATGVWVVDSSLNDQQGRARHERRFSQLIELHRNLRELLPEGAIVIAGPYWGMNLVLWARGLCNYLAVTLGTAYRYHISGGFVLQAKTRVAIPPLRRWAVADPDLKHWLEQALNQLSPVDPAFKEISDLNNGYKVLSKTSEIAREQVANAWKEWFNKIAAIRPTGRMLALYQDLSSAYVLGKQLPELPRSEGTARFPERVAQQLMLNCL